MYLAPLSWYNYELLIHEVCSDPSNDPSGYNQPDQSPTQPSLIDIIKQINIPAECPMVLNLQNNYILKKLLQLYRQHLCTHTYINI